MEEELRKIRAQIRVGSIYGCLLGGGSSLTILDWNSAAFFPAFFFGMAVGALAIISIFLCCGNRFGFEWVSEASNEASMTGVVLFLFALSCTLSCVGFILIFLSRALSENLFIYAHFFRLLSWISFSACFLPIATFLFSVLSFKFDINSHISWIESFPTKLLYKLPNHRSLKKYEKGEIKQRSRDVSLIITFTQGLSEVFPEEWNEWQHWISDMMDSRTRMQSKQMNHRLVSLITFYRLFRFALHIGIDKVFIIATRRATR
jgi:hypothetical protein